MSDHGDIDPGLDAEASEVTTEVRPARNLLNFFKGQPSADNTAVAGPSEPPKKRAYVRKKNAATDDNKQTRLGAGLKPVKVPPVEVQEGGDPDMVTEVAESGPSNSSEKKKPGRKPKQRAVNDEDEEFRAMSKAAKKKPGPKPKSAATKVNKKKDAEGGVSDIGSGSELPRGRKTAKRKSIATTPSRISSPHTNSVDTAIHIPDSPDQAVKSKPFTAKRRKIENLNDADSAIVLDTSFDDDDCIEIMQGPSRSISPDKGARKVPSVFAAGQGKAVHPLFAAKAKGSSATSRAESPHSVESEDTIHVLPAASKPVRKEAIHPDRATHLFFKSKGKGAEDVETMMEMGRKSAPGDLAAMPLIGKPGWGRGDMEARQRAARFPTQEEQTCHARDPEEGEFGRKIRLGGLDLPRRERKRSQSEASTHSDFWRKLYPRDDAQKLFYGRTRETDAADGIVANDQAYKENPAVQALAAKRDQAGSNSTRLWTDKYRPTESAQVLGNEIPSKYLARWMKELALGKEAKYVPGGSEKPSAEVTPKKRKIMRKVKRTRKKRDREDDWIVDDTLDPIEDYLSADGTDTTGSVTEEENGNAVDVSLGPAVYPAFNSRLANSILLQGPHGCGKTAAVYAAAAELGWEVFEVNAGSKRSGAQLSAMVGEVGRNHMVGRTGHVGQEAVSIKPAKAIEPKRNALFQAFAKANGEQASSSTSPQPSSAVQHSNDAQINPFLVVPVNSQISGGNGANTEDSENFGFIDSKGDVGNEGRGIRQSLILFEEVDILYEEDQGFWPQVVELIAGSRRPVVMTCNDLGLIPFEKLPLQCTLLFSPPTAPLLEAYLAEINHLEKGGSLPHTYLPDLLKAANYDHPTEVVLQQPLAPVTLRQVKGIDLRMSIMQLQLDVGCSKSRSEASLRNNLNASQAEYAAPRAQKWKEIEKQAETRSILDAHLSLSTTTCLEVIEIDRYKASADDEEGMHLVEKPLPPPYLPVLPAFSRVDDIAQTLWSMTGNQGIMQKDIQGSTSRLARDRETYQLATLPFLDPVIPLESHLLPSPILFTSYIPAISNMVSIDDALEEEDANDAAQGRPRKNRKTGRMMRLTTGAISTPSYIRQFIASDDMGEKGLQAVRDCRLDFSIFNDDNEERTGTEPSVQAVDGG